MAHTKYQYNEMQFSILAYSANSCKSVYSDKDKLMQKYTMLTQRSQFTVATTLQTSKQTSTTFSNLQEYH